MQRHAKHKIFVTQTGDNTGKLKTKTFMYAKQMRI